MEQHVYMIDRYLELKNIVNDILLNVCNELTMLNGNELQLLNDIIPLLSPIEEATKIVSGDSYCTASTIIPMVNILKEKLANVTPNMADTIIVKDFLLNEIDKRMGPIEQVSILSMATVLDPRFKKLHFKDSQACANSIQKLKSIAKPMATENVKETLINATNNNPIRFGTITTN
ncbi:uncharacterized protein LOC108105577 isoform X4 [Drosophila eugracilis]|uniref:uncharacterized protein LOC108105577 isoform X4 n=1 Tax=Drosophila eugracilis TaxID=29029 RepID=UPI0007E83623|nr:uncharacterized protein LOC108105577 isoform X4 [Drosophila eugracilis]XP_041675596.1 uncharacterized protein LOC108105577 isoform X4 [Drosophila eugracilis]